MTGTGEQTTACLESPAQTSHSHADAGKSYQQMQPLTYDELKDLPPELISQLSREARAAANCGALSNRAADLDTMIAAISDATPHQALTISDFLVAIYRRFGRTYRYLTVATRLASLAKSGHVSRVSRGKYKSAQA